jgi:hypothetical protein
MIVESLAVASMLLGGACLLAGSGARGWGVAPWGFAVGAFLTVIVGFIQVATPLSGNPILTMTVVAGAPLTWWVSRRSHGHGAALPLVGAAPVAVILVATVALHRGLHTFAYHVDSLEYLGVGALLADDRYTEAVTGSELDKRLVAVSLLHAPARIVGEYFLASATPLVALSIAGILAWLVVTKARPVVGASGAWIVASLGVFTLLTMNRFIFHAVYLNGHLFTALGVLALAGACWLLLTGSEALGRAPVVVAALAAITLVLTRPEGPFLALAAIVPVVASDRVNRRVSASLLAALGGAWVTWYGFVVVIKANRGLEQGVSPVMAFAGLALLAFAVVIARDWWGRPVSALPFVYEAGLLGVLAGCALHDPAILRDSIIATHANAFGFYALWGSVLGCLALLIAVSAASGLGWDLTVLRLPVTTFIPLGFILAYVRGIAYRPFNADSFTRMLVEIVPLGVAYVLMTAMGRRRPAGSENRVE